MGWFWSNSEDSEYEGDAEGASSDGEHTTVYWDGGHRSWDTDSQGNVSDDHTTDHATGEISEDSD